jgi:hypothetical protein
MPSKALGTPSSPDRLECSTGWPVLGSVLRILRSSVANNALTALDGPVHDIRREPVCTSDTVTPAASNTARTLSTSAGSAPNRSPNSSLDTVRVPLTQFSWQLGPPAQDDSELDRLGRVHRAE